ncbi:carboxymuconolactone decarboxylase family protein [Francisella sp. Scap27]|uniref:carboxymuconolactone decarboxylase family protein n=1 Tax=Francisella sp. Scap27 TaxID=2589986 RepID=UPI0015B8864F|nr:carboxymuconolactone decarboxylase family protein [Francisella sp. Scap27]QLE79926.1 carboxymuconolactone decarboxylase family protein [Francisella sp. Scap27]
MSKMENGLKLLNKLHGGHTGEAILNQFKEISPKMAEITIENMFGDILQRTNILDIKTRELLIIVSLVTLGSCDNQIRAHTEAAINVGASKEEISEAILQTAYFAGFPKAANALISIKELF